MLDTYRAVFRAPGTAAFTGAGFVMELPLAMYPIGLVLIISTRTGHYGFAGIASALFIAGGIPGGPLLSRAIDRFGQSRVIGPANAVHVAAVVVVAVLLGLDAPDWAIVAPVLVAGFTYLSVGSLVRARWSTVLAGRPELTTAYSLQSTIDELLFVLGPLIAILIATLLTPVLILYVAAALVAGGGALLAAQRSTEPAVRGSSGPAHPSALRERGVLAVTVTSVFMGTVFASAEISEIAFCGQHGHAALSGLVVALYAGGSGVSGFVYGARVFRSGVVTRYRRQGLIFGLLPLLFLVPTNVPVLAVCAVVVGFGTAPALIAAFGLVERLVPGVSLTEGLTWVQVGLSIGFGAGAAVVGGIADAHGARMSFLVTIGAGLAVAAGSLVVHRLLSRAPGDGRRTPVGPSEHAALP